jgi:hypothetical protein
MEAVEHIVWLFRALSIFAIVGILWALYDGWRNGR